ncbi:MAG: hypothetical protein ACI9QD_000115 [Thermoproteota archaeon]|jgi:hypothetical protein
MLKTIVFSTLFLVLFSCVEEKSDFKSEVVHNRYFQKQKKACSKLDLYNNPMNKVNFINMFKCFNWDISYKKLFKAVNEFSEADWDFISEPLNDSFFGTPQRRDDFMNSVAILKEDNGFENLDNFIKVIFKNDNLISLAKELTSENSVTFDDIVQAIVNSKVKQSEVKDAFSGIDSYLKASELFKEDFSLSYKALRMLPGFDNTQVEFFDETLKFFSKDTASDYYYIFRNFLDLGNETYWFKNLFRMQSFTRDELDTLLTIPNQTYPNVFRDVKLINIAYEYGLTCPGNKRWEYNFDLKTEVNAKVGKLINGDYFEVADSLVDAKMKLSLFSTFCSPVVNNYPGIQPDFISSVGKVHSTLQNLIRKDHNFYLFSGFHQAFSVKDDNKTYGNFLSFLSSDYLVKFQSVIDLIFDTDNDFIKNSHDVISAFDDKFHTSISRLLKSVFEDNSNSSIKNVARIWLGLSKEKKRTILNLIDYQFDKSLNLHQIMKYYGYFLDIDENLISNIIEKLFKDEDKTKKSLKIYNQLLNKFSDKEVLTELGQFLSKDSLLRLFELFSNGVNIEIEEQVALELEHTNFVLAKKSSDISNCLNLISDEVVDGVGFYELLATLPSECSKFETTNMVVNVTSWLSESNKTFASLYGTNLIDEVSVLSPEMINIYLSAIVGLRNTFYDEGLIEVSLSEKVDSINEVLFDKGGDRILDPMAFLSNEVAKDRKFFYSFLDTVLKDETLHSRTNITRQIDLISLTENVKFTPSKEIKCSDLNLGITAAINCPSVSKIKKNIIKALNVAAAKTDAKMQFLEGVINVIHPDEGIILPTRRKPKHQWKVNLDFKEIVKTFVDFSDPITARKTDYHFKNEKITPALTTLGRIETLVNDISFSNNFYGAYFENTVANAKNYQKKISKLEGKVGLIKNLGGSLRALKQIPKSTKWLLKNVESNYSGLIEAGENIHGRNHARTLQAILGLVSATSKKKSQKYNPYKFTTPKNANGHKGQILIQLTEMRGLSHFAEFTKRKINNNLANLDTKQFTSINDKFMNRFTSKKLKTKLRRVFDLYLSTNDRTLEVLVNKMIDFISTSSSSDIDKLESVIWNVMYIVSESFEKYEGDLMLEDAESIVGLLGGFVEKSKLTKVEISQFIDFTYKLTEVLKDKITEKEYRDSARAIIKLLTGNYNGKSIVSLFSNDVDKSTLIDNVDEFVLGLLNIKAQISKDDFYKVIRAVGSFIKSEQFDSAKIYLWLQYHTKNNDAKYLVNLVEFLSLHNNETNHSNLHSTFSHLFKIGSENLKKFFDELSESVTFGEKQ